MSPLEVAAVGVLTALVTAGLAALITAWLRREIDDARRSAPARVRSAEDEPSDGGGFTCR